MLSRVDVGPSSGSAECNADEGSCYSEKRTKETSTTFNDEMMMPANLCKKAQQLSDYSSIASRNI